MESFIAGAVRDTCHYQKLHHVTSVQNALILEDANQGEDKMSKPQLEPNVVCRECKKSYPEVAFPPCDDDICFECVNS